MDIVSSEKIKYAFNRLNIFINANYSNIDFGIYTNRSHLDRPELSIISKAIHAFEIMIFALDKVKKESLPNLIPYVDPEKKTIVPLDIVSDFESLSVNLINNEIEVAKIHLGYINYYFSILGLSEDNEKALLKSLIESAAQLKSELEGGLSIIKNNSSLIHNAPMIYEDINTTYKNSKNTQDLIDKIKNQIFKILENTEKDVDSRTKEFEKLANEITENITISQSFQDKLKSYEEKIEQLDKEYKKEIKEILESKENIRMIEQLKTGNLLGGRFDEREMKLREAVKNWSYAVGILLALSIVWIIVVFTCLSSESDNAWLNFLVNSLKTVPMFFVLGFAVNQYRKERNFQEEYAFKASISMTLKAFSEILAKSEKDQYPAQIEMLQKSIASIYTQPRVHTESNRSFFSLHSKDFSESLKAVAEGLKNIKS